MYALLEQFKTEVSKAYLIQKKHSINERLQLSKSRIGNQSMS